MDAFRVVEDEDLVSRYRMKMSSMLFESDPSESVTPMPVRRVGLD